MRTAGSRPSGISLSIRSPLSLRRFASGLSASIRSYIASAHRLCCSSPSTPPHGSRRTRVGLRSLQSVNACITNSFLPTWSGRCILSRPVIALLRPHSWSSRSCSHGRNRSGLSLNHSRSYYGKRRRSHRRSLIYASHRRALRSRASRGSNRWCCSFLCKSSTSGTRRNHRPHFYPSPFALRSWSGRPSSYGVCHGNRNMRKSGLGHSFGARCVSFPLYRSKNWW